jgi:hypothetical protein
MLLHYDDTFAAVARNTPYLESYYHVPVQPLGRMFVGDQGKSSVSGPRCNVFCTLILKESLGLFIVSISSLITYLDLFKLGPTKC